MPHTASPTYTRGQDDCWLPARVARRMIAKHGAQDALGRADAQRMKHKQRMRQDEIRENTPMLMIYWDLVCAWIDKAIARRVPQPLESAA